MFVRTNHCIKNEEILDKKTSFFQQRIYIKICSDGVTVRYQTPITHNSCKVWLLFRLILKSKLHFFLRENRLVLTSNQNYINLKAKVEVQSQD